MVLSGAHKYLKNQRKKQKRGFPIKDFGNDRTDNEGASPLITPGKDENTKRQRKKIKNNPEEKASVSSPLNGSIRNPNYLRAKASGFPPPRHPGNLQAGVHSPQYLKTKGKSKNLDA